MSDDPTKHPIPHMYVKSTVSQEEEGNFTRFANEINKHYPNQLPSYYCDTAAFMGMGRSFQSLHDALYLEVFLGVYGAANSPNVPAGYENKLMLIYAPADVTGVPMGYYTLPDNALRFDLTANKLPDEVAQTWMTNYQNTVVQWLNPYLDKNDAANYPGRNTTLPLTNTLRIKYLLTDFDELRQEIDYQATEHNDFITGFRAFFAALPENTAGGNDVMSNRLKVQFEFIQRDKRIFYIDTTAGFAQRPPQNPHFPGPHIRGAIAKMHHSRGLDNGELCPPSCNP